MANYNPPTNAFKSGNTYQKRAARAGRLRRFATPDQLWQAACLYFEDAIATRTPRLQCRQGKLITTYRVVPMSASDLYAHLGVFHLDYYKRQPQYASVITRIKYVIYEYNYTRAAAGMIRYKTPIIARTLRKDKTKRPTTNVGKQDFALPHDTSNNKHFHTYSPQKTPHSIYPHHTVEKQNFAFPINTDKHFHTCSPQKIPHYLKAIPYKHIHRQALPTAPIRSPIP